MTNTMQSFLESKETIRYLGDRRICTEIIAYSYNLPRTEEKILEKFYILEEFYSKYEGTVIRGIERAKEELQELELESGEEDRKAFLRAVIAILEQCAEANIDSIIF